MGDDSSSSDDSPPRRRKRAPMFYKQYVQQDGSFHVPSSTSWKHRRKDFSARDQHLSMSSHSSQQQSQNECTESDWVAEGSETTDVSSAFHPSVSEDERKECATQCEEQSLSMNTQELPENTAVQGSSSGSLQENLSKVLVRRAQQNVDQSVEEEHILSNSDQEDDCVIGIDNFDDLQKINDIKLGNFEKLKKDYKLESPLISNTVNTSKFECLLMVLNFSMQEGLSYNGTRKLLQLINRIFGIEVIPDSIEVFRSLFECDVGMSFHFYCPKCFFYFGDFAKVKMCGLKCPIVGCEREGNLNNMNDNKFFISLPIAPQMKAFLESKDNIQELLSYRFQREQSVDTIRDVFDGELYKNLSSDGGILSDANNFSLTMNTDGSPVFKSVSNTMWPVQARINELPPSERFSSSNMFVCGVWFGTSEPNMNVFLSPYVLESRNLYDQGFEWQLSSETEIVSRVVTLNCCLDSRAKPDVQCFKQLHSYSGCSYCYHPGHLVNLTKNQLVGVTEDADENILDDPNPDTDVVLVNEPDCEVRREIKREVKAVRYCLCPGETIQVRTDEEMRRDMITSQEENVVTNGVLGVSVLTLLPKFDIVNGFVIDYMHAVLLGVVKTLIKLWVDSKFSKEPYSVRSKVSDIDERLLKFCPPTNISRRPRSVLQFKNWKANELRSWLFFYGVCALEGILPDVYLKHFSLLVSAVAILNSECISSTNLHEANNYLSIFVNDVQYLYGPAFMVHNVHLISHLSSCVKFSVPCWSHSAFAFETGNGVLVNLVRGTVGVMTQIANKYMTYRCTPLIIKEFSVSNEVKQFCDTLVPKRMSKTSSKLNGITILDSGFCALSPAEADVLSKAQMRKDLICYHGMIINGVKYDCETNPRKGTRSNNSIVKVCDGSFGVISRILIQSKTVHVILKSINIDNISIVRHEIGALCKHIKVCSLYPFGGFKIIRAKNIIAKCVFLKYKNSCYVAEFPNTFEKD